MRCLVLAFCVCLISCLSLGAAEPQNVSYAKDVKPFLAKYCLPCHSGARYRGGLNMETYRGLMKGGQSFEPVKPGKPEDSVLVTMTEGRFQPIMPPKNAKQPKPEEVAILRAWVAEGAKDDSASATVTIPDVKPRGPVVAPISAAAYRPDGKLLAAGGRKEVFLIETGKGEVVGRLPEQPVKITAIGFSRDGKLLAVAGGTAATSGEVRLYVVPAEGSPAAKPDRVIAAHSDLIHGLAFSPDGTLLATCGYDRLIKLWSVETGKEVRSLTDHSDAVNAVAFSPDGKLLASGSSDRAVKVWETATGKRLLTLSDATDWVYTVAWSPDGRFLAAAGVDKSIRVWTVTPTEGQLVQSAFAHEGPVLRLVYAANGQILYSLSEDRTVKAWTTANLTERTTYPKQPEAPLTLAVRPDHKQLAVGRFDGALVLLNEADGQVQAQPLPVKPQPPSLNMLGPASGERGRTIQVTFGGANLDGATEVTADVSGVSGKLLAEGRTATRVKAEITIPPTASAGLVKLGVKGTDGAAEGLPFIIDLFPRTWAVEPNNSPSTGQPITLPATVAGSLATAGDVDCFRFEAAAGLELGVQAVTAALGSKLEPVLQVTDLTGRVLAESSNGVLGYKFDKAGSFALTIRDKDYRGGTDFTYRLHAGDLPVVTSVFPLGVARSAATVIYVEGVHLEGHQTVVIPTSTIITPGEKLVAAMDTRKGKPLGNSTVIVGEFPEVVRLKEDEPPLSVPVPGTANGRILRPGGTDLWSFSAKKGQRLIVEVAARRLGSPLDSAIEILDASKKPVPRATLCCLAKTYTVFRDHDSAGGGIRIETWNDLAINDYLFVGTELVRIKALPKNPDDDCQFVTVAGQRVGYLDTTPTHHSLGTPMYKVSIQPPGTTFPPNGLPVFTLAYRNDDGGPGYGKDSRLFFDAPADGDYFVRVADARGEGGLGYGYRLTVRPPQPTFQVSLTPTAPAVWRGGGIPVSVTAERLDGYDGPISLKLVNLPQGYNAPETAIPAGETSTAFALFADEKTAIPPGQQPFKLVARAAIDGQEVVREVMGGVPSVLEKPDLVTAVAQTEVVVQPGKQVTVTATIERKNGFAGRVPLDVRGLPHGVRVLDIGLNGVLITERETSRTFVIYCEPWVQPLEHPLVVLARREDKNTEFAAKSVLLKVTK